MSRLVKYSEIFQKNQVFKLRWSFCSPIGQMVGWMVGLCWPKLRAYRFASYVAQRGFSECPRVITHLFVVGCFYKLLYLISSQKVNCSLLCTHAFFLYFVIRWIQIRRSSMTICIASNNLKNILNLLFKLCTNNCHIYCQYIACI